MGLPQSVLGQMINDILLTEAARSMDIAVSDNIVREAVRTSNAFRSNLGAGGFDRQKFQSMLYQFRPDRAGIFLSARGASWPAGS